MLVIITDLTEFLRSYVVSWRWYVLWVLTFNNSTWFPSRECTGARHALFTCAYPGIHMTPVTSRL